MFDVFFGNSYIDTKYDGRLYLEESYDTLKRLMNDSSSSITVKVLDSITGFFSDRKTIQKSEITYFGSN